MERSGKDVVDLGCFANEHLLTHAHNSGKRGADIYKPGNF